MNQKNHACSKDTARALTETERLAGLAIRKDKRRERTPAFGRRLAIGAEIPPPELRDPTTARERQRGGGGDGHAEISGLIVARTRFVTWVQAGPAMTCHPERSSCLHPKPYEPSSDGPLDYLGPT
ncbi:hypothetical protein NL676_017125 [Syzygium grande]|nr:hypothetical protein NL676_017125 [Syzygium grande]